MRWHTVWSFILLLLFSAATYLTYLVSRAGGLDPVHVLTLMQNDLASLGPAAFLLDFIVLYLIIRWIRRRRTLSVLSVPSEPRVVSPLYSQLPPMIELPPPEKNPDLVWSDLALLRDYGDENL